MVSVPAPWACAEKNEKKKRGGGFVREVTSGLLVFRLFFSQEAGERDDVCVDLLSTLRAAGREAIVGRHLAKLGRWI